MASVSSVDPAVMFLKDVIWCVLRPSVMHEMVVPWHSGGGTEAEAGPTVLKIVLTQTSQKVETIKDIFKFLC